MVFKRGHVSAGLGSLVATNRAVEHTEGLSATAQSGFLLPGTIAAASVEIKVF